MRTRIYFPLASIRVLVRVMPRARAPVAARLHQHTFANHDSSKPPHPAAPWPTDAIPRLVLPHSFRRDGHHVRQALPALILQEGDAHLNGASPRRAAPRRAGDGRSFARSMPTTTSAASHRIASRRARAAVPRPSPRAMRCAKTPFAPVVVSHENASSDSRARSRHKIRSRRDGWMI